MLFVHVNYDGTCSSCPFCRKVCIFWYITSRQIRISLVALTDAPCYPRFEKLLHFWILMSCFTLVQGTVQIFVPRLLKWVENGNTLTWLGICALISCACVVAIYSSSNLESRTLFLEEIIVLNKTGALFWKIVPRIHDLPMKQWLSFIVGYFLDKVQLYYSSCHFKRSLKLLVLFCFRWTQTQGFLCTNQMT